MESDCLSCSNIFPSRKLHFLLQGRCQPTERTPRLPAVHTFLTTAREGNVFKGVCHSAHNRPHGYSVTAHPCYSAVGTHPTDNLTLICSIPTNNY